MARLPFDVGIIIPLPEEYRFVTQIAQQLEAFSHEGKYYYRLDFGPCSAICTICGRMGTLTALHATSDLLKFADVKLLVLLGLGGALDKDVAIGDVVIADEINDFQANSKAVTSEYGYEVSYSGRHWSLDYSIREAINHFEFASGDIHAKWKAEASERYKSLAITNKEQVCSSPPAFHVGPLASGNVVAASSAFVNEVRRINRKFLAIDMEAAGVAAAAFDRIHSIPCLVIRGMSDHANEAKQQLETEGKGAWRQYCVNNACSFLKQLLSWPQFQRACRLNPDTLPQQSASLDPALLARQAGNVLGGPWLVGLLFGTYFHGPLITGSGTVTPVDISRLMIADPHFATLMESAKLLKPHASSQNVNSTVAQLAVLLTAYRNGLGSQSADSLLADFDRVVVQALCPNTNDDAIEAMLREADWQDQNNGPISVIKLLSNVANTHPQLRERYIIALATAEKWAEIDDLLKAQFPDHLSRSELENHLFSLIKLGQFRNCQALLAKHESAYADNAALMFRKQIILQHSELARYVNGAKS
jgi:nucleoside phosphorylase